jgi:hypothetical protein
MVSPDDEILYSRRYLRIRAIFIFSAYIFLFLAAGTEIIDVASAYFNITRVHLPNCEFVGQVYMANGKAA